MLGKYVTAFYDTETDEIVSIAVENTEILSITSEDIENVVERTITYFEADRPKKATLSDSFSCIKNGKSWIFMMIT